MADSQPPSPAPAAAGSPPARDEAIPMLTEIVQVPRYQPEELPRALEEVDWSVLSERVRENVTERLARRSQALLDAALRDSLQAVVDRAAESLATDLRESVMRTVRDLVAQAVNEEITRVHAEIARRPRT
ncbi:MAG: hypothetical protein EHM87_06955 [Burkholderiales bacterium]|nr:MAG: hypothetical protein EHM87_06955 [Burkholderiales bacterium]